MRDYYVSKEVIENLVYENSSVECYVQTKENSNIIALTSIVEKTDSEVGRHDLAILYKTATINGHTFQLGFDFVDYGAGGLEYGEDKKITQEDRQKLLNNDNVLIYELSEEKDKSTIFFKVDVLADDTGVLHEIESGTKKVNITAVISGLNDGSMVILPVSKEDCKYAGVFWEKNFENVFRFHNEYMPKCYTDVACILNDKVTVPKDFVLYDFLVMKKQIDIDVKGNKWVSLSYDCCLNTLDLLELDKTGKTHMYILDNFKDIDKHKIYLSFMNLNKEFIDFETLLRVVEKVQPESTKWVEDCIVEKINKSYLSTYIDVIVKYVRVAKKSKDKDVERFLDMMLHYSSYAHMDGYVRILKALKLKDTELEKYIDSIIAEDKLLNQAGRYVSNFIREWKTESFKVMEDYLYEGIQMQEICELPKDCNRKTEEEKQRRGLNTDYDFVSNYMSLLRVKGVDKVNLIKRFVKGIEDDSTHFPVRVLLHDLEYYINYEKKEDMNEIIPLFVEYIVKYDTYGDYAKIYLPHDKQRELGFSYSMYTHYTDAFEPYIDVLSKIVVDGKKKKADEEWAERTKSFKKW